MNKRIILSSVLAGSLIHASAFAHSGGTNTSGCHTVKKTGEYHCHGEKAPLVKTVKIKAKVSAKTQAKRIGGGEPVCAANVYNCADFKDHEDAQHTYAFCLERTGRDVHDLDRDKDGLACEQS